MNDETTRELIPPQSLEAEQSVLGACLIDRRALEAAALKLKPRYFYHPAHVRIFTAMLYVYQDGALDLVTLANRLKETEELDRIGGASYLAQMADMVPSTANIGYYADIVYDKALRRGTLYAAQDLERWAYDEAIPTPEMLTKAEARVLSIAEQRGQEVPGMDEGLDELGRYLNAGRSTRIPLYLESLNDYMGGGLMRGFYTLIGADPGIGKTRLVVRDIYHQLKAGRSVRFFSLEIPRPEIMAELMALVLEINREGLGCESDRTDDPMVTTPSDQEYRRAAEEMRRWPLKIFDGSIDAEDMEPIIRREMHKGPVDVVHVDYAGLIGAQGRRGPERMEDVSQSLTEMYKRCQLTGIVLCHVTSDGKEVHPWYSRKLEQDCQSFWYIPKPEEGSLEEKSGIFHFRNIKNRYAKKSRNTLNLGWGSDFGYFEDMPKGQRGAGM